jgi:hypothetical protein
MPIVIITTLQELKTHVKAVTSPLAAKQPKAPVAKAEHQLVKELKAAMAKSNFGCQRESVAAILTALTKEITGEVVGYGPSSANGVAVKCDYGFPKFAAITLVEGNKNDPYVKGGTYIVADPKEGRLLNKEGLFGSSLFAKWRYATVKEIDALFSRIGKSKAVTAKVMDRFMA